jgi:SNF2 family DNA or RNA helicase
MYKSKSQTILDIILSFKSGKYIIYSDYSDTFDTLKRYLFENDIKYTELKGVKSQREKSLENYRVGDIGVLLLTTLQYSAGIDLMNTTDIVLYHDMSESTKTQIIGRANRIGRKIPLKIHCMF